MGVLIYHEWASLLALSSGVYVIWAGMWAIMYRKFAWDIVGGTLGPHGIIPGSSAHLFIDLIVTTPILQIVNIINGMLTLLLEYSPSRLQNTRVMRSLIVRVVFYLWCSFIALLPYQTLDAGIYYAITSIVLLQALRKGEVMKLAKSNRGSGTSRV